MSEEFHIDSSRFWRRLVSIRDAWQKRVKTWSGVDILLINCGKTKEDDSMYKKNNLIHTWLFGFELLNTIMLITKNKFICCAGEKICNTLKQIESDNSNSSNNSSNNNSSNNISVEFIIKQKSDKYNSNYNNLIKIIKSSKNGKKIGFIEEKQNGNFICNFLKLLSDFTLIDISLGISEVMMIKDSYEIKTMKKSGEFTSLALKYFQKQMEDLIENEKTLKHSQLSKKLLNILEDPKSVKSQLKKDYLDVCYEPIIQSGGEYKLKVSAIPDDNNLHYDYGTIVCILGYRFRDYCTNIGRTFLIDASEEQKEIYNILINVFKKGLLALKNDKPLKDIYEACLKCIRKSNKPQLESNFIKNVGWGIGLEFRDKNYIINKKNLNKAKSGMIFNFQVGFDKLQDKYKKNKNLIKASNYSLFLADTVMVTDDQPKFITKFQRKLIDYQLADDIEMKDNINNNNSNNSNNKNKKKHNRHKRDKDEFSGDDNNNNNNNNSDLTLQAVGNRRVTRTTNRKTQKEREKELKSRKEREKTQNMLREKSLKKLKKILRDTSGDFGSKNEERTFEDPKCYNDISDLPSHASSNRISIDKARYCIICPIMDHRVPFHISTIKNAAVSNNGEWTHLRINLISPVAPTKTNREPKQPDVAIVHPNEMYIKELNYRSNDGTNLQQIHVEIKNLQKKLKQILKQSREQPLVDQEKLRRNTGNRILLLKDLTVRPSLGGRKRGTGKLECHLNGFRYTDHKRNEVRVMFNNIDHAFYQPSKGTPSVIIHFHLKNNILLGKKSTKYVQVYRDVMERYEEIGRSNYDYDGIRHEQEEKRRIVKINKLFKDFIRKVEDIAKNRGFDLEFDIPEMDLGFYGVPNKQLIQMYPTRNCIIALEDTPQPFVLSMREIQLAHFERVAFSLRNFDLVFIQNDFSKECIRISSIPREHLDTLQDFLNWQKILFNEGKRNLDWKELLRTIRDNFEKFVNKGGWGFLTEKENRINSPNRNNNNSYIESGSEYNPSDDAMDDEYLSDEEDEYDSEDDYDSEEDYASDNNNNNNNTNNNNNNNNNYSSQEEEEEEEGLSWDELDRRAAAEDRKSRMKERNNEFRSNRYNKNPKRRRIN